MQYLLDQCLTGGFVSVTLVERKGLYLGGSVGELRLEDLVEIGHWVGFDDNPRLFL